MSSDVLSSQLETNKSYLLSRGRTVVPKFTLVSCFFSRHVKNILTRQRNYLWVRVVEMWGEKRDSQPVSTLTAVPRDNWLASFTQQHGNVPDCFSPAQTQVSAASHNGTAWCHEKSLLQSGKYFQYENFTSPLKFYQNHQKSRSLLSSESSIIHLSSGISRQNA